MVGFSVHHLICNLFRVVGANAGHSLAVYWAASANGTCVVPGSIDTVHPELPGGAGEP